MSEPSPNLCVACVHYIYNEKGDLCGSPDQPVFDLVLGQRPLCRTARLDPGQLPRVGIVPNHQNCGPSGKYFEKKPVAEGSPLWRR